MLQQPLSCFVKKKVGAMYVLTFVRIERSRLNPGTCEPWAMVP
jgi:hypothetical protein